MNDREIAAVNGLRAALKRIAKDYCTPAQLRRQTHGLEYEEALEMAYENIQHEARTALKTFRAPRVKAKPRP
jgi:hypothetical protein